jgi:hypothetical protein
MREVKISLLDVLARLDVLTRTGRLLLSEYPNKVESIIAGEKREKWFTGFDIVSLLYKSAQPRSVGTAHSRDISETRAATSSRSSETPLGDSK